MKQPCRTIVFVAALLFLAGCAKAPESVDVGNASSGFLLRFQVTKGIAKTYQILMTDQSPGTVATSSDVCHATMTLIPSAAWENQISWRVELKNIEMGQSSLMGSLIKERPQFAEMFKENAGVRFPKLHPEHSTLRVLTLEDVYFARTKSREAAPPAGALVEEPA